MNTLYILLICIFSIIISNLVYTIIQKYFHKKSTTNNGYKFNLSLFSYFFWASIGIIFIAYFITFRFYDQWKSLFEYFKSEEINNVNYLNQYQHSIILSKGFLLDMCPFMSLALPISFVLDKSTKTSSYLAPFCIFGGAITIPFIFISEPNVELNAKYIFVGTSANPLYFMIHWFILVFGILALRRNKNPKFINLIYLHLIAIIYFTYIIIISRTLNVTYNVTGTVKNDWTNEFYGSYYNVSVYLHLPYPYVMIVSYLIAYILIVFMWLFKTLYFKYSFVISKKIKNKINILKNKNIYKNTN